MRDSVTDSETTAFDGVFISYATEDRADAVKLAEHLEQRNMDVWWDRDIVPGSMFSDAIEEALTSARCVVVLWSTSSVDSHWVQAEASEALNRGTLVPVMLDQCTLPLEFRRVEAALIGRDWDEDGEFTALIGAIEAKLATGSRTSAAGGPTPAAGSGPATTGGSAATTGGGATTTGDGAASTGSVGAVTENAAVGFTNSSGHESGPGSGRRGLPGRPVLIGTIVAAFAALAFILTQAGSPDDETGTPGTTQLEGPTTTDGPQPTATWATTTATSASTTATTEASTTSATEPTPPDPVDVLAQSPITDDGIGAIRLGMRADEIADALPAGLVAVSYDKQGPLVDTEGVTIADADGNAVFYALTLPGRDAGLDVFVLVHPALQTAEGIGPGSTIAQASVRYSGVPTLSYSYADEGREFVRFERLPYDRMMFRVDSAPGEFAGIYDNTTDEYNETSDYQADATIGSVWLSCRLEC